MSDKKPNKVYLALRKIYCLRGAEFCRKELEMGWKEIEKLQAENEALKAKLQMIEIMSEFIETAKKLKSEFQSLLLDSTDGNYQPIINNLNDDNAPDEE